MNPLEALNLLIQAASIARLTKQEHVQIEQAGLVLQKVIEHKSDDKKRTKQKAGGTPRDVPDVGGSQPAES